MSDEPSIARAFAELSADVRGALVPDGFSEQHNPELYAVTFTREPYRVLLHYDTEEEELILAWAEGLTVPAPCFDRGAWGTVMVPQWRYVVEERLPPVSSSADCARIRCCVIEQLDAARKCMCK